MGKGQANCCSKKFDIQAWSSRKRNEKADSDDNRRRLKKFANHAQTGEKKYKDLEEAI